MVVMPPAYGVGVQPQPTPPNMGGTLGPGQIGGLLPTNPMTPPLSGNPPPHIGQ